MIVSNTTPISNFLHLSQIEILQYLFREIHIPYAVKQEIEVFFSDHKDWKKCLQEGFFAGQAHLIAPIFYLTTWYQEIHREIFGSARAVRLQARPKNHKMSLITGIYVTEMSL